MRNTSFYSRRVEEGGRVWFKFKPSCTRAALQENSRYNNPGVQHTVERKDCGPFAMLGVRRRKAKKQRPNTFERWSYQKIASLLASQRLQCSHPSSSRHVPIFFLCTVFVLCISLANRGSFRVFSSIPLSPFPSRILRNEDRIRLLSWRTSVGGMAIIIGSVSFWIGEVSGTESWGREMLWLANRSPRNCLISIKGGGLSICFLFI